MKTIKAADSIFSERKSWDAVNYICMGGGQELEKHEEMVHNLSSVSIAAM